MSKGLEIINHYEDSNYLNTFHPNFMKDLQIVKKDLQRLEAIDNAKPSEALKELERIKNQLFAYFKSAEVRDDDIKGYEEFIFGPVKQTLLKAQEQEKENEILKEIIKSLFDRGCPLHQYTDKDLGLTIEVDNECSVMHLGEFKGVDLDKKLKEVLE